MTNCIFIAGTDTDVGKTFISSLILKALKAERLLTCGFKPVASGGIFVSADENTAPALVNPDALTLQQNSTLDVPYQVVNPYCFEPAIAPHVAASEAGVTLSVTDLDGAFAKVKRAHPIRVVEGTEEQGGDAANPGSEHPQIVLSEGAGGWHVPLNDDERLSDWVIGQQMGVILVVGLKLGCINHALLTSEAIISAGVPLLGWIANRPSAHTMSREADTLAYLKRAIRAPLLADVSFSNNPQHLEFDSESHHAIIRVLS